jgi:ElaB/YqjD/DUF883 family membrane-anchored ribosome-binding protein
MTETVLEREPKVEKQEFRRSAEKLGERVKEGVEFVKKFGRTSSEAAEEFMEDTNRKIRRHPAETVVGAFAVGIAIGALVALFIRRK